MANKVIKWDLSGPLNPTDVQIDAQASAGALGLLVRSCTQVGGVATDNSGNIYVSDAAEHVVLKIDEAGNITTIAGQAGTAGDNSSEMNVVAEDSRLDTPRGLAVDNSGTLYIADSGNNQVRSVKGGYVSVLTGNGSAGLVDGTYNDVELDDPRDVAVDNSGTVYIADTGNNAVRRFRNGQTVTFAGDGSVGDAENGVDANNGTANIPAFDAPEAVAVDPEGNVYVCDTGNNKIKKVTTSGQIFLHSGSGTSGHALGTAYTCQYENLLFSDVDRSGNLYVIDGEATPETTGVRLVKVDYEGVPYYVANFDGTEGDNSIGVAVSPNQSLYVTMGGAIEYSDSSN
jgi:streptogramin lyase